MRLSYLPFLYTRPGLLEAWLALTSVKYHGNLYILIPLNQRLALTRLRATGPRRWSHLITTLRSPVWKRPFVTNSHFLSPCNYVILPDDNIYISSENLFRMFCFTYWPDLNRLYWFLRYARSAISPRPRKLARYSTVLQNWFPKKWILFSKILNVAMQIAVNVV